MSTFGVVVPAYNGARFVERCIDSILSQSFRDYELIVVDDGSTDETLDIVKEKLSGLKSARVVHQSHNGVSVARNLGLSMLKTKWVTFIDADDYVSSDFLESNLKIISKDPEVDIVIGNLNSDTFVHDEKVKKKDELMLALVDPEYSRRRFKHEYGNCRCIGGKVYKMDFLKKNGIIFPDDMRTFEDGLFNLKAYYATDSIYTCAGRGYHYSVNNASASRYIDGRVIEDNRKIVSMLQTFTKEHDGVIDEALPYCYWNLLMGSFRAISEKKIFECAKRMRAEYKRYCPNFDSGIKRKFLSYKSRCVFFLAKCGLFLPLAILYKIL